MPYVSHKHSILVSTFVVALTAATIPLSAEAWYSGGHHGGSDHYGHHGRYRDHNRQYLYGGIVGYLLGSQRYRDHHYSDRHEYSPRHRGGGCHAVSKIGYDDGREARIGGTRCYDEYGEAYIVPGSRYVIDYY